MIFNQQHHRSSVAYLLGRAFRCTSSDPGPAPTGSTSAENQRTGTPSSLSGPHLLGGRVSAHPLAVAPPLESPPSRRHGRWRFQSGTLQRSKRQEQQEQGHLVRGECGMGPVMDRFPKQHDLPMFKPLKTDHLIICTYTDPPETFR